MKKSFKSMFSITLALVLAISLAACGSSKSTDSSTGTDSSTSAAATAAPETAAPSPDAPKEVKEISLLMFKDWYNAGMQAVEKDINDHATELGFKLNIEKVVGGGPGNDLLKARFAANEMPQLLATYGAPFSRDTLGGLDNFQDLSGDWTKNFSPAIINAPAYTQDGKIYGIPFDSINIMGVFYNKKVFAKLNIAIPTTYQEFLDACEKIKAAGIQPIYAGYKDTWTINAFENDAYMRSGLTNGELFAKVNTNQLKYSDMDYLKDAFMKHKDLIDKGYIQKTYLSDGFDSSVQAVAEGTAAMIINATWIIGNVTSKFSQYGNDIGAFRIPYDEDKKVTMLVPYAMEATKAFTDKDLLKKFVDYFSSTATQKIFFDAQPGIPSINGVDPKLLPFQEDMKKIAIDEGNGDSFFADYIKYDAGDSVTEMVNYFLGKQTAEGILKTMDTATAKDAKAKGSPDFN